MDELGGRYSVGLNDLLGAEIVDHSLPLSGAGDADRDIVRGDLQQVPVT